MSELDLQFTYINGRKIIARRFYLEALHKVHRELKEDQIGTNGTTGFVLASETTGSWRRLATQKQLVAKGVSWTLYSNHRRGTAVDSFPDWTYIRKIQPVMEKYGLVNDLSKYGDGGHWNWISNEEAQKYPLINNLPDHMTEFSEERYDNHLIQDTEDTGTFALVYGGEKHVVEKARAGLASLTVLARQMPYAPLTKKAWDSIPKGKKF